MKYDFHKNFIKAYQKLPSKIQSQAEFRLSLFEKEPFYPSLNNHALTGKYKGYRSINITGDYRAIYKEQSENEAMFIDIGTHSQLYG